MRESVSGVQKPKKFTNHRAIHSCSASQYADDILLKVLLEIIKSFSFTNIDECHTWMTPTSMSNVRQLVIDIDRHSAATCEMQLYAIRLAPYRNHLSIDHHSPKLFENLRTNVFINFIYNIFHGDCDFNTWTLRKRKCKLGIFVWKVCSYDVIIPNLYGL